MKHSQTSWVKKGTFRTSNVFSHGSMNPVLSHGWSFKQGYCNRINRPHSVWNDRASNHGSNSAFFSYPTQIPWYVNKETAPGSRTSQKVIEVFEPDLITMQSQIQPVIRSQRQHTHHALPFAIRHYHPMKIPLLILNGSLANSRGGNNNTHKQSLFTRWRSDWPLSATYRSSVATRAWCTCWPIRRPWLRHSNNSTTDCAAGAVDLAAHGRDAAQGSPIGSEN